MPKSKNIIRAILLTLVFFLTASIQQSFAQNAELVRVEIEGMINLGTLELVERTIHEAADSKAAAILINLNTPGGFLDHTRKIVAAIEASKVPVIVLVGPARSGQAASAGTFIVLAAHTAAMTIDTTIGAAHPVGAGGSNLSSDLRQKIENDTVAWVRAIAQRHFRNPDWSEKAVRESVAVSASEARNLKIIEYLVSDEATLLEKLEAAGEYSLTQLPVRTIIPSVRERVLHWLGQPDVGYVLLLVGVLGVSIEFLAAGTILPGAVGALALILGFVSFSLLPVTSAGLGLLILALCLFVAEIFITSFGLLTLGGLIALVVGAMFLIEPTAGNVHLSMKLIYGSVASIVLVGGLVAWVAWKTRGAPYKSPSDLIGAEGVVRTVDADSNTGTILVRGAIWKFQSDAPLQIKDIVEVKERIDLVLVVNKKQNQ